MRQLIKKFFNDESATTAIEYAIIAGGLSIVIVTVVNNLGSAVSTKFVNVSTSLK
jgi:pilus assembly protein Flp/PilA